MGMRTGRNYEVLMKQLVHPLTWKNTSGGVKENINAGEGCKGQEMDLKGEMVYYTSSGALQRHQEAVLWSNNKKSRGSGMKFKG